MAGLQYKNDVKIVSGGYSGEWKGSDGTVQNWTDVQGTSGTISCRYYYHDSLTANNAVSSRVWVTITDQWENLGTTYDNHIRVKVNTVISRIERVNAGTGSEGSWNSAGTTWSYRWHIQLYRERLPSDGNRQPSSSMLAPGGDFNNLQGNINQVILNSNVTISSHIIDLPPQSSAGPTEVGTVFYQNATTGHENDADGSQYVDRMWMGANFRNTLPVPTPYKLTYSANGGSGAPLPQEGLTADGHYTFTISSTTPTWGSYKFLGWSRTQYSRTCTDADVEYRAGDTITLQESSPNLTLYACWEKDYRPGQIIDNNGVWQSHNRSTGADNIYTGSSWNTMRTIDGAVGTDNPPYMRHTSDWKNQRKIGANK